MDTFEKIKIVWHDLESLKNDRAELIDNIAKINARILEEKIYGDEQSEIKLKYSRIATIDATIAQKETELTRLQQSQQQPLFND